MQPALIRNEALSGVIAWNDKEVINKFFQSLQTTPKTVETVEEETKQAYHERFPDISESLADKNIKRKQRIRANKHDARQLKIQLIDD